MESLFEWLLLYAVNDKMFPKIKKKIASFLLSEEGKISKQSMLSIGSFLSAGVIGAAVAAKDTHAAHTNNIEIDYHGDAAAAEHAHHSSHSSHASHSSGGGGGDCSCYNCHKFTLCHIRCVEFCFRY